MRHKIDTGAIRATLPALGLLLVLWVTNIFDQCPNGGTGGVHCNGQGTVCFRFAPAVNVCECEDYGELSVWEDYNTPAAILVSYTDGSGGSNGAALTYDSFIHGGAYDGQDCYTVNANVPVTFTFTIPSTMVQSSVCGCLCTIPPNHKLVSGFKATVNLIVPECGHVVQEVHWSCY